MSASPKLQEPSMEEILASIRRIIADDQARVPGFEPEAQEGEAGLHAAAPAPDLAETFPDEHDHREAQAEAPRDEADDEPLLSRATDASVGQAFGVLAHTVLSGTPRPVEDIVREMLRPMLRTWLDDNLPSIVERLVRAEIERVARGARRSG